MTPSDHPAEKAFARAMSSAPLAEALDGAAALLVGYSGGADSAALLTLMARWCAARAIPCEAIHVHHGIRGAEADRDAELCRTYCAFLGVPLHVRRADVPAYAEAHHLGIEEAARKVRYRIFDEILAVHPGALCATAHSADDHLETVLFHLLRGSGIDGLCGIPAVRGRFIRPLLGASAAEIRDFCKAEGIPAVQDSTNEDTAYTRNYIRAEIVPRLRRLTPAPEAAAVRMSALLRADAAYLQSAARDALGEWADDTAVPLARLTALPDALLSRAVSILYENAAGGRGDLAAVHIRDVTALVRGGVPGRIDLPGDYAARLFDRTLSILPREECAVHAPPEFCAPLAAGENFFPEYGFCLRIGGEMCPEVTDGKNIYKLSIWNSFPYATIQNELHVRLRRPGDTVRLRGMTRSVKKLLNEKKIPPEKRAWLPFVCAGEEILWIPGVYARETVPDGSPGMLFCCFAIKGTYMPPLPRQNI